LKDLIMRIVQALVDHPEQVEISEVKGAHVSVLELKVAKEDIGKVIGKKGRNVQAIRTILSNASGKEKKLLMLRYRLSPELFQSPQMLSLHNHICYKCGNSLSFN